MKKKITILSLSAFILFAAFTLLKPWNVDVEKSKVRWELPFQYKTGTFSNLNASIYFDKKNLKESKITASIDVKTIKVGNEKKEAHLLSPDFFDVEKFPAISFTSKEIISSEQGYIAKGNLQMKDSIKPCEIPFTFTETGENSAVFKGTMTIYAQDFGLLKRNKEGSDKVLIYLEVPVSE